MSLSTNLLFSLLLALIAFISLSRADEGTETSPNPVPASQDGSLDEFGSKSFKDVMDHYRSTLAEPVSDEEFAELQRAAASLDALYKEDKGRGAFSTWTDSESRERFSWKMCLNIWGRFCGPGYCDDKVWDTCNNSKGNQLNCNFRGSIKDSVDSCCRDHDKCCVFARTNPNGCMHCRSAMVSCLDKANTDGWAEGGMRIAMKTFFKNRSGCC